MSNDIRIAQELTLCMMAFSVLSGCASQPPAHMQQWIDVLERSYEQKLEKNDISKMLNASPSRCEPNAIKPKLGFTINKATNLIIREVDPTGPAARAGIHTGERLVAINSKTMATDKDFSDALRDLREASPDTPHKIATDKGEYVLKLYYPQHSETCYWESSAGRISTVSGSSYFNQYGGSGFMAGKSREEFFRLNCDFDDGVTNGNCRYHAQW